MASPLRIGLISDTHGLLRPEALKYLEGSALIIHCGDICDASVLDTLGRIAPVQAVRGNNDRGEWARSVPHSQIIPIGDHFAYAVHDVADLDIDPVAAGVAVVLSGHSHKPTVERRDGVLYVNPGSAGPRRFKLPVSVAELMIEGANILPRIQELEVK